MNARVAATAKALEERGIFECFAQAAGLIVPPRASLNQTRLTSGAKLKDSDKSGSSWYSSMIRVSCNA